MRAQRVPFRLDGEALAKAGASRVLALSADTLGASSYLAAEEPSSERSGVVGVLDIVGPLAQRRVDGLCGYVDGYDAIARRFAELCADPDVSAIVLRIDSPGGDLAGLEEGVRRMCEARDAVGKPVYAYADEFVASAAYWLASSVATSGIYLPAAGYVGSIGVLSYMVDETKAMERAGVGITVIRDPAGKAASDSFGPVMDVAVERTQEVVTSACDRFCAAVRAARPKVKDARELNGAMLSGGAAVSAGLADGVMSFEGVLSLAAEAGDEVIMGKVAKAMGLGAKATEKDVLKGLRGLQRAAGRKAKGRARAEDDDPTKDDDEPEAEDDDEREDAPEAEDDDSENEPAAEAGQLDVTCPNCGHEFSVDLPDERREESAMAAGVRRLTGKQSARAALSVVGGWRASHAQIGAYEDAEKKREAAERVELVASLVRAGEPPATAWASAGGRVPAEPWASMPIGKLRARVKAMSAQPLGLAHARSTPAVNGVVTSEDAEIARRTGVSESSLAAARAEMARAAKGV